MLPKGGTLVFFKETHIFVENSKLNSDMITTELIHPKSIVVAGASNNVCKPGGAVLKNLIEGGFEGELRAIHPKEETVQGVKTYASPHLIPDTDMAVLALPAALCPDMMEVLAAEKGVKAFVVVSAGFGEVSAQGAEMEQRMVDTACRYGATLIGPNCIGMMNTCHQSVFCRPLPQLSERGVDFVSGSGATAVFIMDNAMSRGLRFHSVWSVGNSRQTGVEEVLAHLDEGFSEETSSHTLLLYIESITQPEMLLEHASSLIRKGCRIAAVKAGSSECGSRAATSHTGAAPIDDVRVDELFRQAGIVRCYSRSELVTAGCIFSLPRLEKRNIAIVTHAGGPAVMLTDALSKEGMMVPELRGEAVEELKSRLYDGSAVGNPIDILATGTPEHLAASIDCCEQLEQVDGIVVILGTAGLTPMYAMYDVLSEKMRSCSKPVYPVLTSSWAAADEIGAFLKQGNVRFDDEVLLGTLLARVYRASANDIR